MSRCPQCLHDNPPGARFCNGCGARTELACTQCGLVNPSGSRFCNECGAKLGDPVPAGSEPRFTSPETYTPKQRLLGAIAAHPDRVEVDIAEGHYRQALALAEELGLRPLTAHCHLGLGRLYRGAGTRQQAREHITTETMFREMDMRYWREQAETAMRELP